MVQSEGLLEHFRGYSLSIASHPLAELADFPDSRTFYSEIAAGGHTRLPIGVRSILYMATCNRIEVYAEFAESVSDESAADALRQVSPVFDTLLSKLPSVMQGAGLLEHLIAVASGLKSLALGETQIAGQIKRDMAHAQSIGWISPGMMTLLKKVLETQKKIRTNTGISEHSYSLMTLVSDLIAERQLQEIRNGIILIGASEMSAKVARFALRKGVSAFMLVRKDRSRSMNADLRAMIDQQPGLFTEISLADFHAGNFSFLADAIVLASTAQQPLLNAAHVHMLIAKGAMSSQGAIVDLSLPANVDNDIAEIFGEKLISLSSLQALSDAARAERNASAQAAEPIIRRAVYQLWLDLLYRENPVVVRTYLDEKTTQTDNEWQKLAQEAALSEKQKRIMYDFMKKEQRRALASHREMILDLISGAAAAQRSE